MPAAHPEGRADDGRRAAAGLRRRGPGEVVRSRFSTAVSQDGDQASAFFLQYDGGRNKFAFSTTSGRAYANTTARAGTWYHLVAVRDAAAGTYTLYLNGQKQGMVSQCLGDASTGPLAVGRAKYNGNNVDFLRGSVDDVRVFDRALSDAEVQQLFGARGAAVK